VRGGQGEECFAQSAAGDLEAAEVVPEAVKKKLKDKKQTSNKKYIREN